MKKIILSLVIFSLVLGIGGVVLAQELEKIPSPDQIKNFKVIKKEGKVLYGFRLEKSKENKPEKKDDNQENLDVNDNSTSSLEKILTPKDIPLFEKVKKIGTSLFGVRKNKERKPVYITPTAAQCVKDAISKKDTALKTATTNHSQSIVTAIDTRSTCQKAAIDKLTAKEQFDANKVCIKTFQDTVKEINILMKKTKNETRKVFQTDLKACSALQLVSASSTVSSVLKEEIQIEDGDNNNEIED